MNYSQAATTSNLISVCSSLYIFFIFRGDAWNVIGGDDCVGVMVPGNLVTVTVPQGQEMTEDFKFPLVLILQSSWDIHSYIFFMQ